MRYPSDFIVVAPLALFALAPVSAQSVAAQVQAPAVVRVDSGGGAAEALSFGEIFKRPVGPYGLELSAKVVALDGRRVRISGFMVLEEAPIDGRFLLAPLPATLSDVEDGPADDLPPAVVFVTLVGRDKAARIGYQREPLQLTGVLHVGNEVEPDGRVSTLRLELGPPEPSTRGAAR